MGRGGVIQEDMYAFFSWEHPHTGVVSHNFIRSVIFELLALSQLTLQSLSLNIVH